MDVYCPICAEPWDIDTFHDVAADEGLTFDQVRQGFTREGCAALQCRPCQPSNDVRALASQTLLELYGDDIDGVAADLEDFEYLGLLDGEL